jgi:hypothetical protein
LLSPFKEEAQMRIFLTLIAIITMALLELTTPAAAATQFYNRYLSSGVCYLRLYDVKHMRANPKQTLSKFHVVRHEADPLQNKRPAEYTVRFGYWIKNAGYYDGLATCKTTNAGEACSAEADGGNFAMTAAGQQIKVTLGARLGIEGSKGFSPNVATDANRTMLLPRAPRGSCQNR